MEEEEIKEKQIALLELQKIWIRKKGGIFWKELQEPLPISFPELEEAVKWWGEENEVRIIDWELIIKRVIPGENPEGRVKIYYKKI